jgi:hypothetical protein
MHYEDRAVIVYFGTGTRSLKIGNLSIVLGQNEKFLRDIVLRYSDEILLIETIFVTNFIVFIKEIFLDLKGKLHWEYRDPNLVGRWPW